MPNTSNVTRPMPPNSAEPPPLAGSGCCERCIPCMGVGWGSAARRLVWRKELVHALGFSPPRQQSDGREQQTNENDGQVSAPLSPSPARKELLLPLSKRAVQHLLKPIRLERLL